MNLETASFAFSEDDEGDAAPAKAPAPAPSGHLTLADLLSADGFGLRQLTGPDPAGIPLLGAHTIEIENPTRWLPAGWVVLTTGMRLRGDAAAQRALVTELVDANMAGLGYSIGMSTRSVPAALLSEAMRFDFPVFSVPQRTPMYLIVDFVRRAKLRRDPDLLRQAAETYAFLAGVSDRVGGRLDEPVECAILRRLSALLGAEAGLLDPFGNWLWPAGLRPLPDAFRRQLDVATGAEEPVDVTLPDGVRHALPVRRGDHLAAWLLFGDGAEGGGLRRDLLPVVWAAANLVSLVYDVREHAPTHVAALRGEVFAAALRGPTGEGEVHDRMTDLGFTFRIPSRVVLVAGSDGPHSGARELHGALSDSGAPFLVLHEKERVLFCIEADEVTLTALLARSGSGFAAVGAPVRRADDIAGSLYSAELVFAQRRGEGRFDARGGVGYWEDLGPAHWLMTTAGQPERAAWARRWLDALAAHPALMDAAVAYLAHDQDIGEAARELFLHPNSLRYRLVKVEQLFGRRLRQPSMVADLYAAFVAIGRLPRM